MTTPSHIEELARDLRDATHDDVPPQQHWGQRRRFLMSLGATRPSPWRWPALAMVLSVTLVVAFFNLRHRPEALRFENQTDAETGWSHWTFTDGSQVELAPGASARVTVLQERGASIELARGLIDVFVNPRPHAAWEVTAGAHTVTVTGTRFTVERGPRLDDITVQVSQGRVLVHAPGRSEPIVLGTPGARYSTCEPAPPVNARPAPPPRKEPLPTRSFEEELVDADQARLSGEKGAAEQILTRLRGRFPRGPKGAQVAFKLGKLLEYDRPTEAAAWYALALRDHPDGPLAADAAGRRLMVLMDAKDRRATGAAETVLEKFPDSSYAQEARRYLAR